LLHEGISPLVGFLKHERNCFPHTPFGSARRTPDPKSASTERQKNTILLA
jgi:hypothetical protein